MKSSIPRTNISLPEMALIAGTRGILGLGIGFLIADRLSPENRKAVGWTLLSVGLATTVPLALDVLAHRTTALPE